MTEIEKAQQVLDKLKSEVIELQSYIDSIKLKEKEDRDSKLPFDSERLLELSLGSFFTNNEGKVSKASDKYTSCSITEKQAKNSFLYRRLKNAEYIINTKLNSFAKPGRDYFSIYYKDNSIVPCKVLLNGRSVIASTPFRFGNEEARDYFMKVLCSLIINYFETLE